VGFPANQTGKSIVIVWRVLDLRRAPGKIGQLLTSERLGQKMVDLNDYVLPIMVTGATVEGRWLGAADRSAAGHFDIVRFSAPEKLTG
jgi:hypothetical protein